jgi:hypothetical protein
LRYVSLRELEPVQLQDDVLLEVKQGGAARDSSAVCSGAM